MQKVAYLLVVFLSEGLSSPSTVRERHIVAVKPTSQLHEVSFVLFPYIGRGESCIVMRQVVPEFSQLPLYFGQDHGTTASDRPGEVELRDTHQQQVGELNNPLIHALRSRDVVSEGEPNPGTLGQQCGPGLIKQFLNSYCPSFITEGKRGCSLRITLILRGALTSFVVPGALSSPHLFIIYSVTS